MERVFDKREDVSELNPSHWAFKLWETGCENNWMPQTIDMSEDIKQWRRKDFLTESEKLLVKRTLGVFSMGESLVSKSITTSESKYITDGNCQHYMIRKAFEESLHNYTVDICCNAYGLHKDEVKQAYKNIPTISRKQKFISKSLSEFGKNFDIESVEGKQMFVKNMFIIYLVCEGIWFFPNFALIMSLGTQNKLMGLNDQIKYTIRDETVHIEFGVGLMMQIVSEYPEIWTESFKNDLIETMKEGVAIEKQYAEDILPEGILGVNSHSLSLYVEYLANERLRSIGLDYRFPNNKLPFEFLKESQEGNNMAAFFERREKSYRNEAALDDDF